MAPKKRGSIELPVEMDSKQKPVEDVMNGGVRTVTRMVSSKDRMASSMSRLQDILSRTGDIDSPTLARHADGGFFSPEPDSPLSPNSPMSPTVFRPGGGGSRAFMLRKNQSVPELASPATSTIGQNRLHSKKRGSFQDSASIKEAQRFSQLQGSSSTENSSSALSKWVSGERLQRHEDQTRNDATRLNLRQLMKLDDRVNIDEICSKNYQMSSHAEEDEEDMFNRSHRKNSKIRHAASYRHKSATVF